MTPMSTALPGDFHTRNAPLCLIVCGTVIARYRQVACKRLGGCPAIRRREEWRLSPLSWG